jgi:hypothetical protein
MRGKDDNGEGREEWLSFEGGGRRKLYGRASFKFTRGSSHVVKMNFIINEGTHHSMSYCCTLLYCISSRQVGRNKNPYITPLGLQPTKGIAAMGTISVFSHSSPQVSSRHTIKAYPRHTPHTFNL